MAGKAAATCHIHDQHHLALILRKVNGGAFKRGGFDGVHAAIFPFGDKFGILRRRLRACKASDGGDSCQDCVCDFVFHGILFGLNLIADSKNCRGSLVFACDTSTRDEFKITSARARTLGDS